jgi:hypothetical protein
MIKWYTEHNRLARKEFNNIKKILEQKNIAASLPKFSSIPLEWIAQARPTVEGVTRNFLAFPYWEEIYKDSFHSKIVIGGRQIFKSTYLTDMIALEATTNQNAQICYVTFSRESCTSFSRQKLQIGTFANNPLLLKFLRRGKGNVGEISLKNNSTIYCTIDTDGYKNVEGKSILHCFLDESQYQQIEESFKVVQTMMATKGRLTVAGIGGQAGSAYQDLWNKSDQRKWIYDDQDWRQKLQFDQNGLVIGEYLTDILRGRWVAQQPDSTLYHGYQIPQTIFPTIPLTEDDAILLYRTSPMYSIEHQKKNLSSSDFTTHVLGEFYNSTQRPVTPEMVLSCMTPYRYLSLMTWQEMDYWRDIMQDDFKVGLGVDWGSGNPSNTVIAIIIKWRPQSRQERYQLAYLEKRPAENQLDQAEHVRHLLKYSKCDTGVGDLGYGANQVKTVQNGGHNRETGKHFDGVGQYRFLGCRTVSNEAKPVQYHKKITDEHGEETGRIDIDKTAAIQRFIDLLGTYVVHPLDSNKRLPKLMIPFKEEHKVDWLIKDFTSITRKDLEKTEPSLIDPRQNAKKEFNHPKDSVMAIIYALQALELDLEWKIPGYPPARRWKE